MKRLPLLSTGVLLLVTLGLSGQLSGQTASAESNLLKNPGFEAGEAVPESWGTFPRRPQGIAYLLDDEKCHSGKRSALVKGSGGGFGMWQQVVDVQPGRVYLFTSQVAFEKISPPGECRLQLVFRDAGNRVLQFVNFPAHTGSREFALDFPPKLKVRAPDGAARVEVNLYLSGTGRVWFDDVFFGLAPTGHIRGKVTSGGKPLEDARVSVWGDPWGKRREAFTDAEGNYRLADLPVTFPRYVLLASKNGYQTRPAGDLEVKDGGDTGVDFDLAPGNDPDDLRVKFGTLSRRKFVAPGKIPEGAVIPPDAGGYPQAIRPYLKPDEYIRSDHPDVVARGKELVDTLSPEDRADTRKVAWAVYQWVSRNIDHGGVFSDRSRGGLQQPYRDVTSGIWQTISGEGWCWGKNFLDWCYRPHELLEVENGICVEHAWLVSAIFRSLNIPARAAVGSLEFWAQDGPGDGRWVHLSTTGGRTNFREHGRLGLGFGGGAPEKRFSVLSRPILHEDWNSRNKGLWREQHPWGERYEGTPDGYRQAKADLDRFAATGKAPRVRPPRRAAGGQEAYDLAVQRQPRRPAPGDHYQIHYSDVTINLFNMHDQRTLDVRFPLLSEPAGETIKADNAHWTNHPECVRRTWVEKITNPPAEGTERWFHIEFDLTSMFSASSPREIDGEAAQIPRQTAVYTAGTDGYHTYRIPSVIVTGKGTVLAFAEGRKAEQGDAGDIDLLVKRSTDGGRTFSAQQTVWDDAQNTCGNPCPVVDQTTGTIWLLLTHNLGTDHERQIIAEESEGSRTVWVTQSNDDGLTWAEPVEITATTKRPNWTWYATGPGCGIQLAGGRLVIPCDHMTAKGRIWGSHVIYSDDHGATWKLGGSASPKTNECEVVELADGRLLLNMRNYNREHTCRAVATSSDQGDTFSEVSYDETLVEPICQASIRRYSLEADGGRNRILFSNPSQAKARKEMTVRLSYDECRTWPVSKVLHAGPAAYSCLARLPDGTILCLYERGSRHPYQTITLARFSLDWLTDGKDKPE